MILRPRTLAQALEEAARSTAGYTFVEDGVERRRTYAEILIDSSRAARALGERGLARGDLVALVIDDAEQFLTALFGVSLAGLIPALLAPPTVTGRLDRFFELTCATLSSAGASAVVTTRALVPGFEALQAAGRGSVLVLARDELEAPATAREHLSSLDDIAFVQFTSGSTSRPKGVAISHRSLSANIEATNGPTGLGTSRTDSGVSWLPLFHDMGLVGMALGPLYCSRPVVLLPPHAFVKRPVEWLRAISRHRATVSFAPTFGYDLVVRRLKDRDLEGLDLSCWRVAGCGAEPIYSQTLEAFARRLEPAGFRATSFLPCYGLAEHVLAATLAPVGRALRVEQEGSRTLVSCGRPLPGHQLRVVAEDGREAAERESGEIALAGPSVMLGYHGEARLTAQTIRSGWLHTGDFGYLSDGELFVCGRLKETIIVNGRKHYPHDVEWLVDEVEGVRRGRAVAFGVPQPGSSDRLVVIVEIAGGAAPEAVASAIRRRVSDALGLYVDEIFPVPAGTIGRTTSGKVQRAAGQAYYAEKHGGSFALTPAHD